MIKTLRNRIQVFIAVLGLSAVSSQAAVITNQAGTLALWDGVTIQFIYFYSIYGIMSDAAMTSDFYHVDGDFYFRSTYGGLPADTNGGSNAYFSQTGSPNDGSVVGSDNWLYLKSDAGNFGWVQVNLNLVDPVASSIVQYAFDNTGASLSLADARNALSPVPEPSTMFTLGGGLLALAVWRGVRRKVVSA